MRSTTLALSFTATLSTLISSTCASDFDSKIVLRADEVIRRPYATLSIHEDGVHRRAAAEANKTAEGIQVKADGTIDLQAWEDSTDKACKQALSHITESSNPSGNCICYNLPSLDTKTGVFAADLRLYQISEPRGPFAGMSASDIKVSVAYKGASASTVSPDQFTGAGMVGNVSGLMRRDDGPAGPKLMQLYLLVGQIDKETKLDGLSLSAFEALTLPTLTLSGTNSSGAQVTSEVSLNEASFLTGVFSDHVIQSDFAAAQAAVNDQLAALANGTVAFVLPGTQVMILPIGSIITSIWLVVGLTAYGVGTFQRMHYAAAFRERSKAI